MHTDNEPVVALVFGNIRKIWTREGQQSAVPQLNLAFYLGEVDGVEGGIS